MRATEEFAEHRQLPLPVDDSAASCELALGRRSVPVSAGVQAVESESGGRKVPWWIDELDPRDASPTSDGTFTPLAGV